MAETKRVSDQYTISSPTIVLDGNLTVMGSTTSVETINSTIKDNIIVLNKDESGTGVTQGTAGIEVERGIATNTTFLFNESADAWETKIGGSFAIVRGASPVSTDDFVTKGYLDTVSGDLSPGDPLTSIQFNSGGSFAGTDKLTWNGADLLVQDLSLSTGRIYCTTVNSDFEISAYGTGKLYLKNAIRMENLEFSPTSEANSNVIFTKIPGNAGSGLYFNNGTDTDEVVSRSKAILFGLIF